MSHWPPPEGRPEPYADPYAEPYTGPPSTARPPLQPDAGGPAYPAPGYPGYPAGGYQPWAAGHPMGYPVPFRVATDPRDARPGVATAAAVLAFVNAGLLLLAGGLLLLGASILADVANATDSHPHYGAEIALAGAANLVAGGLLIAGGVMIFGRKPTGRVVLRTGSGVVAALTLFWLVRFGGVVPSGFVALYAVLFTGLAVVSVALSWLTPVTAWLMARRAG